MLGCDRAKTREVASMEKCGTCGLRKASWKAHRDYVTVDGIGRRQEMWLEEGVGTVLGSVCTGHSDAVVVNLRGGRQAVFLDQVCVAGPFTEAGAAKAWIRVQGAGMTPTPDVWTVGR